MYIPFLKIIDKQYLKEELSAPKKEVNASDDNDDDFKL